MSTTNNPYGSKELKTTSLEDAEMKDSLSHSNSTNTSTFEWALSGQVQGNPLANPTANILNGVHDETINFKEDPILQIPSSFSCTLHEELYVCMLFWLP